jgi:ribosome assembly protein YihI (activator of Der GTPase)
MPVIGKAHVRTAAPMPSRSKDRERAWIQRVATQLVARKRRTVDETHADARTRERQRGHGAGRPGADYEHIATHRQINAQGSRLKAQGPMQRTNACPISIDH